MGFFLLGRDRNSDELRLLTSDLVETSEAALERLSVLVSTPEIRSLELDYFIGNFAAATPVLLVVPAQPEALPVEGDAGVWETPISYSESDAVLEEILSEAIIEVPVEPEAAEATPVPVSLKSPRQPRSPWSLKPPRLPIHLKQRPRRMSPWPKR